MTATVFSTYPAVRDALVARIPGFLVDAPVDADHPQWKVTYGDPGKSIPERYVAVGTPAEPIEHSIKRLPHDLDSSVDEDYTIEVVIWRLVRSRNDPDAQRIAVLDVHDLAKRIDTGLRTSQAAWTLDDLVTHCYVARLTPDDFTLSEGRASQLVLGIDVRASRI